MIDRTMVLATSAGLFLTAVVVAQSTPAPSTQAGPRPFPGVTTAPAGTATTATRTAAKPQDPPPQSAAPLTPAAPDRAPASALEAALNGAPVYPPAEFLDSFDAGHGQRYYLYGTNAPYLDIVSFYRTILKNNGRELYKAPAMQQFDLGKFQEETMSYPPSVVVKDYADGTSVGYVHIAGTTEKHFKTIIQIVPTQIVPTSAR